MRKMCFGLMLLVIICTMLGCVNDGMEPTVKQEQSSQITEDISISSTEKNQPVVGIPMPKNPKGTFAEYDPERNHYILAGGVSATKYGGRYSYIFQVISKQQLESEDIEVELFCENDYEYTVNRHQVDYRTTEYENGSGRAFLPFYLYQNYVGVDFSLAGRLYGWYLDPPEEGSEEAKEMEAVTGGRDPKRMFDELVNTGVDGFAALEPEDTREFYLYDVFVTIDVKVEETITEMEVTIAGQNFHEKIGTLELIPDTFPAEYSWPDEMLWEDEVYPGTYLFNTLYGQGIVQPFVFEAVAVENLEIEKIRFLGEDFELLDAFVTITSSGNTVNLSWDGKTPYTVYAGDHVYIEVVVRNEILAQMNYEVVMSYELVYSHNGEKYSTYCNPVFKPNINYHEIYAVVFDGVNMEFYYRDYYYPIYQQWQKEYQ